MDRRKASRQRSKRAVVLRVLAAMFFAAFAAAFAWQVLLCRSALEATPMLLEYPDLGQTPPLSLELFQRRVGEKAENSAAWQGTLQVDLPGGAQPLTVRVALSNWGQVAGLTFAEGDFYPPEAVLLRQYQAVVPEGLAAAGEHISIENTEYTVCGVYQSREESAPVYLSAHPQQANSTLAPTRMLLAQNDRLRLSVLYDLQAKANYTPQTVGVDLGLWRQLMRQEVYGVIFCCSVLLGGCLLLRGYTGLVRWYAQRNNRKPLALHLAQLILAVVLLNLVFCGVNIPAELLAALSGTTPLWTAPVQAAGSDYLVSVLLAAKQLAVLGFAAVVLFACAGALWILAGKQKPPVRSEERRPIAEKTTPGRWRYHAPAKQKQQ